jgi:hypothetical protein
MIYQEILKDGRGYGKPHVIWIGEHRCWRAYYRGCYSIWDKPCVAVTEVIKFYKSNFRNRVTE